MAKAKRSGKSRKGYVGNQGLEAQLRELIKKFNEMPSQRGKVTLHPSQKARADALFRMCRLIWAGGFKIAPSGLGGRHIEFLMGYWTADQRIVEGLIERGSKLKLPEKPYKPSYIKQQLSFLRALFVWLGKPEVVLPARRYVSDPSLVTPATNAKHDRTLSGVNVEVRALVDKVTLADPVVGLQFEVLLAFSLKRKEAVMFCPTLAEVPVHALPAGTSAGARR